MPGKEHLRQKKKVVESHRLLYEKQREQKCEDEQLQESFDDDPTQTRWLLAEALHASQETISRRLQAMGKISKLGKWVPHAE